MITNPDFSVRFNKKVTESLLHELFSESVTHFPEKVAIQTEKKTLTYTELAVYSNYFADQLMRLNVKPNQLVSIIMDNGFEQVVAVLSILKSGAAYLPIDPIESKERLAYLLKISESKIILTQKKYEPSFRGLKDKIIISIDTTLEKSEVAHTNSIQTKNTDLAYVLFTSGSTGTPKGVMVSHQNVLNTILDINERFSVKDQDKLIALSKLTFDLSVYDIFGCLLAGGTLAIPGEGCTKNPKDWETLLFQNKISIWNSVPALMDLFLDYLEDKYSCVPKHALRLVLLSGDWIPLKLPEKIRRVFGDVSIISLGGATEASIWSILYPIKEISRDWKSIPYGKAMTNQSFHILDKQLNPVVNNEMGELFIGGLGVAQGYWHDEERTYAQFIQHPLLGRLYKTGDLGRYLADSTIEFLGRIDFQVKIAGYRIEVSAIEKYLLDFPGVEQAIVLPHSEGHHKKLAAYLILNHDKLLNKGDCTQLESKQINYWQKIYDDLCNKNINHIEDSTFYTVGWISSAQNKAIPATHMHEWIENTVRRILDLQPKSIFEIGCGTGLLLFRLSSYVQTYEAIDFSKTTIEYVKDHLEKLAIKNVQLHIGEAKDIHQFNKTYDLVILNSVIQYFPSVDHLIEVLNQAIAKVKAKGYIFIGDVRSLAHIRAFYSTVLLEKYPCLYDPLEWKMLLDSLVEKEDELLLDTHFFYALQKTNPRISHVEILLKEGQFHNEMNCFRYDVILYIDHPVDNCNEQIIWKDFEKQPFSLEQLKSDLLNDRNNYLAIKNIPNKRTVGLHKISNYGPDNSIESLSDLKKQKQFIEKSALEPKIFFDLEKAHHFFITVKWSDKNPVDFFDIIIRKSIYKRYFIKDYLHALQYDCNKANKPLNYYANLPILSRIYKALITNIQVFIRAHLPWYMVPNYFVIMQKLPISVNGKIDRKNLPKILAGSSQRDIEQATTPIQKKIVKIWKKILGITTLGIHHDFIELGGTSLLAVQIIGEIHTIFGVTLNIQDVILNSPTASQLALLIEEKYTIPKI